MINILQVGLGPLGIKINQYIAEKESMSAIAGVDINPNLVGQDLGKHCNTKVNKGKIYDHISKVPNLEDIDIAVLTTSSSLDTISSQVLEIIEYGIPIVSTCEELTFPWHNDATTSQEIDKSAKKNNVAVVSTGVNPGFLMDTLPAMLTGICKEVSHVSVKRVQDATSRRVPFQQKIGAGLTLPDFESKKANGSLRHVGLTESMHFIADSLGWEIDYTEDVINPVVSDRTIETENIKIAPGNAMGVQQIGVARQNGKEKIKLYFEATIGTGVSYDEIVISGNPNVHSKIEGGVNGDIATCSIVLNAIPNVLKASPGLWTMKDLPIVSYTK